MKEVQGSTMDNKNKYPHQELYEGMDIALWRWDIYQETIHSFFGLEKLLGYTDMELLTSADFWISQWHPEDKDKISKQVKECIKTKCKEFDVINRIKHKDGHYVWFYTKATMEFITDQQIFLLGVSINVDKLHSTVSDLDIEKQSYSNFLKAMNAATWVWNVQTGATLFDERWAEIVGYTLDELRPLTIDVWNRFVHPDDLAATYQILQDVFARKETYYIASFRMKHKLGHYVWISDRGQVITWTDDGKPLEMVGIHLDITKQKELEQELFQRQKRFQLLVESSYDIIFSLDLEGNMLYLSPSWTRLLGYPIEDVLEQSLRPFVHPDDLSRLEAFFIEIYKTGDRKSIERYRLVSNKGEYRWYNANATVTTDDTGKITGFVGTARDITARIKLEDVLSYERDLFKKTLFSVADAVISADKEGRIVIMNPDAQKLIGYDEKEAHGAYLWDVMKLFFENDDQGIAQSIEALIKTPKERFINQATLLNKKGRQIAIELSLAPIRDPKGTREGIVIVFRDISDKLKRQKEIEFLSYHDYLTGLYNRRYMDQAVQDLDKDRYLPLGVMILDVNDLKEMNDNFGHQSGDDLLKKVSRMLELTFEKKDILGRIGGDEFLALIPNTTEDAMYELKHKLIDSFSKETMRGQKISVALGYSIKLDADVNIYDVMRYADDYMYANKEIKNHN